MTELLAFEALDLDKIPRPPLAIVGVHLATSKTVAIILSKEDDARRGA